MSPEQPLELILARNLLSSISTPAFLVGEEGKLLFFNEAAGALVGRRYEETGTLSGPEWTREFGPFDEHGNPLPYDQIPAVLSARDDTPYHGKFRICAVHGHQEIAASVIPIVGPGGSSGGIVFFWPVEAEAQAR
jgi:PAS domain-containing protein